MILLWTYPLTTPFKVDLSRVIQYPIFHVALIAARLFGSVFHFIFSALVVIQGRSILLHDWQWRLTEFDVSLIKKDFFPWLGICFIKVLPTRLGLTRFLTSSAKTYRRRTILWNQNHPLTRLMQTLKESCLLALDLAFQGYLIGSFGVMWTTCNPMSRFVLHSMDSVPQRHSPSL